MATSAASAAPTGSGSLWNPNSWHWESRNHSTWSATHLRASLASLRDIAVGSDGEQKEWRISLGEVVDMKSEATINIRKGKKIIVFDVTFKVKWEGRCGAGADAFTCGGELSVNDIMYDDKDEKFPVKIVVTTRAKAGAPAAFDSACEAAARGPLCERVRVCVREFADALLAHDAELENQAELEQRRVAERKLADEARAEKGEEKERLAREARAREAAAAERARAEAAAREAAARASAPAAVATDATAPQKVAATTGTGSVWNANSYHWEEKPLTPWAKERLTELLKGFSIDIPGGHVKVVDVTLTGDASASIRKGKKLVFFDFKIHVKWEGELVDGEGNVLGTGDGEIDIPELDQDSVSDYVVKVKEADDGGASDKQLKTLFVKHGLSAFKDKIAQFVRELVARG